MRGVLLSPLSEMGFGCGVVNAEMCRCEVENGSFKKMGITRKWEFGGLTGAKCDLFSWLTKDVRV